MKRKTFKKTPAEKQTLKAQRRDRKLSYNEALSAAAEVLYDEAVKLREQFGQHSVEYYLEELMQRSRISKGTRGVSRWNVFVRDETVRRNEGQ